MKSPITTIFSTGVHLEAVECAINGVKQWRWVATNFEDETFLSGEEVNPIEYAKKRQNLIEKFECD